MYFKVREGVMLPYVLYCMTDHTSVCTVSCHTVGAGVRLCSTPTTLRELEMAPTCSELDDMDVDEDADTFSDSECCGANEFDPLCRGEE